MSKGLGSNLRSNSKNVWLTLERIRLTSFSFSWFLLFFVFNSILCTWKAEKCTLSINHLARIHKTSHVNFRINQKMRELVCSQQCPWSINVSFIFTEFEQQEEKKPWTLGYILVLQTMSSPLNCFLVWTNWCSLQNDAMYTKSWFVLVLDPSVKALEPI